MHLLVPNTLGKYNFTIVFAIGMITDGKCGSEINDTVQHLFEILGVEGIWWDIGIAWCADFNADKIKEAVLTASLPIHCNIQVR